MNVLQIINTPGPLPLKTQFNAPLDGPALLVVTGSLWSNTANVMLVLFVYLDSQQIATVQIFSNGTSTHRVLPTLFLGINLTEGSHVLTLSAGNNANSDGNDTFNASLIY
jgi:hypothetical protein